jgi:lysozyme
MDYIKLKAELARDEGRKLTAYKDTNGYWTIGVGHLLGTSPRMSNITDAECDALLDMDIDVAVAVCRRVFDTGIGMNADMWHILDDVRQRALVNMAFNRGEGRMQTSTTITPAIRTALVETYDPVGRWKAVSNAIIASPWASQIGARATRLAKMLETGQETS